MRPRNLCHLRAPLVAFLVPAALVGCGSSNQGAAPGADAGGGGDGRAGRIGARGPRVHRREHGDERHALVGNAPPPGRADGRRAPHQQLRKHRLRRGVVLFVDRLRGRDPHRMSRTESSRPRSSTRTTTPSTRRARPRHSPTTRFDCRNDWRNGLGRVRRAPRRREHDRASRSSPRRSSASSSAARRRSSAPAASQG